MRIIGCDYHPSWQQVCWVETTTGETEEVQLEHASGEATRFYRQLPGHALIGMESTGNCQWFVEMATTAGHDVWIGDAARIRAAEVRQQKHDRRDAALILKLLLEGRFPRIWTPSGEERDLRQLLIHRYKLVRLRATTKNELQHLAMNQGVTKKRKLWSQAGEKVLRELPLKPWASRRREDLFKIRRMLDEQIDTLDAAVVGAAEKEREGQAADDPARRRTDDFEGLRADDGRCKPLSARKAGGELSGADSARVQFRREAAAWFDQQTRKPVHADVDGGSGAECGALRSGISE